MRAACYSKLGGAEVLDITELETPEPGPGEVRVHVKASGVNPSDWKARKIGRGGRMAFELIIPHNDGAGVVDVAGEGVDKSIVGKSKKRIEIEALKISLKRYYYYLGKHVAKQYISKGYSDFSLDDKFKILNKEIKETLNQYKDLKNKEEIKNK